MAAPLYGVPVSIDGPPPSPPALTLIGTARTVPTTDDRWINGAATWRYGSDLPDVYDPCQASSSAGHAKDAGTPVTENLFGAYAVLEGITCTTRGGIGVDSAEWMRRVELLLEARQHWAIENEFWSGALMPTNPHLAQTTGTTTLNGGTATSVKNAIALLEQHIADKGGDGVMHMRPAVFSQASHESGTAIIVERGVAHTQLGTPIVPGVGYSGSAPDGTPAATTVEWAYCTGPIEVRKSEIQILPANVAQATDRAQNTTTFRAERYVLITWAQRIHAAVKIDRSFTTFTS